MKITTFAPRFFSFAPCFFCLSICLLVAACTPPEYNKKEEPALGKVNLDLRNKQIQQIYNLRDKRQTDSLLLFLTNRDVTLRYLAALSFASVRDTSAIASLASLLQDPVEDVRVAAAFSLGQIGSRQCERPLIAAFFPRIRSRNTSVSMPQYLKRWASVARTKACAKLRR